VLYQIWKRDEQEETGTEVYYRHNKCSKSVWKTELDGTGLSYVKHTGTLQKRSCFSVRVMGQWKELDEETAVVDKLETFKMQLGQFGY